MKIRKAKDHDRWLDCVNHHKIHVAPIKEGVHFFSVASEPRSFSQKHYVICLVILSRVRVRAKQKWGHCSTCSSLETTSRPVLFPCNSLALIAVLWWDSEYEIWFRLGSLLLSNGGIAPVWCFKQLLSSLKLTWGFGRMKLSRWGDCELSTVQSWSAKRSAKQGKERDVCVFKKW